MIFFYAQNKIEPVVTICWYDWFSFSRCRCGAWFSKSHARHCCRLNLSAPWLVPLLFGARTGHIVGDVVQSLDHPTLYLVDHGQYMCARTTFAKHTVYGGCLKFEHVGFCIFKFSHYTRSEA